MAKHEKARMKARAATGAVPPAALPSGTASAGAGPGADPEHEEIARLAHALWEARGCPAGSPEEDWFHAETELRNGPGTQHGAVPQFNQGRS